MNPQVGMPLIFIFSFSLNSLMALSTVFVSFQETVGEFKYEKYPQNRVKSSNQLNIYSIYL